MTTIALAILAGFLGALAVPASRWLWANRSKALSAANARVFTPWHLAVLVLLCCLLLVAPWRGCELPSVPGLPSFVAPKVTAVTYVHDEKAVIPSGVSAALNELNSRGIMATAYPDDASDGDDQVPDQYKVTLPAAKAAGIPSLVVQAGERVLGTVKEPTTKAQVLEAVP